MWTQIVGKIRLSQTPWLNHSWHVALYVTARGLTTSPIPFGERIFQIDFDFIGHLLRVEVSDGAQRQLPLRAQTVADFYAAVMAALADLGVRVKITEWPNEVPNPIRFSEDRAHDAYDPEFAHRFWKALLQVDRVFKLFRSGFIGKCSPVHFFWSSFDLAVTRFSGRRAPLHPAGVPNLSDELVREAYSHEVSSAGFWREELREFILPYDAVRTAQSPNQTLLEFLQSTYEAAAGAGNWDRAALECPLGRAGLPRAVTRPGGAHRAQ